MAIIEQELPIELLQETHNEYAVRPDADHILQATKYLVANEAPFIDASTNPDIAVGTNYAVYAFNGEHPAAKVSRAIEGTVMFEDWQQSPEQSQQEAKAYEQNSLFFLVVDTTDVDNPKPSASLRIADCLKGESETVQYYKAEHGNDAVLPKELTVTDEDVERGLWDIVGVMATKESRGGFASAWAYHALYKASQQMGVHRWISNITDNEFKNLDGLGIPFKLIEGTQKVEMPRFDKPPILLGFYDINVDDIRQNMTNVISGLESATEHKSFYRLLAKLSRIAMDGAFTVHDIAA